MLRASLVLSVVVVLTLSALGQTEGKRQMPSAFKSDGCTLFPDGNYRACCVQHDEDYYVGGSLSERRTSDKRLRECVRSKGTGWRRRAFANAMYLGVRIGGVHFLPTPFRWGFGNKFPRKEPELRAIPPAASPSN